MTIQPPGAVPDYENPNTAASFTPAAGLIPPAAWGDQLDVNFENKRWSKGCLYEVGSTTLLAAPNNWLTLTSTTVSGASDSDGYFDPASPDRLTIPTGRGGVHQLFCSAVVGDNTALNAATIINDCYILRAVITGVADYNVELGTLVAAPDSWPVGTGMGFAKVAAGDIVQFQIGSSTSNHGSYPVLQGGDFGTLFGARLLGALA